MVLALIIQPGTEWNHEKNPLPGALSSRFCMRESFLN